MQADRQRENGERAGAEVEKDKRLSTQPSYL